MTMRIPIRTLLFVCVLACASGAQAGEGWWGKLDEGEAVSLKDILAAPREFRSRTLTFFCIYHGRNTPQYFDPMRTPFSAKRYDNFSVWPDGTALWEEKAFKYDAPFLYIPRTHAQRDALFALPLITRIEITGKIRAVLRGSPCIEVFSFRQTGHRMSKPIVTAVIAGDNYARMGTTEGDQLAARKYRDALAPDLPPVYDMMVRKRLAGALRRLGHHEDAGRVARGEILGGGGIPDPAPGLRDMPSQPVPFNPPPDSGELPTETFDDIGASGAPPAPAMPAAPPPAPGFPPAAPAAPGNVPRPAAFPEPAPSSGADMPGVPYNPSTPDADLPGERTGGGGMAPVPPPMPGPGPATPPRAQRTERAAPPSRSLRGIPPKRRPRLSGVR